MQQWQHTQSNPGQLIHNQRPLQSNQGQQSWQQQQQETLRHVQHAAQQPGSSSISAPAQTTVVQLSQSARQPKRATLRSSKSQLAAQSAAGCNVQQGRPKPTAGI